MTPLQSLARPAAPWLENLLELLHQRGGHASKTVVLMPNTALLAVARNAWAQKVPTGFVPQFETALSWAEKMAVFEPRAMCTLDLRFDMAYDLATAQSLLAQAGLAAHIDLLAERLVAATSELAATSAAILPPARLAWCEAMQSAVGLGLEAPELKWESIIAHMALQWAATSAYRTDILLEASASQQLDMLLLVHGLQTDLLLQAVLAVHSDKAVSVPLLSSEHLAHAGAVPALQSAVLHACKNFEEEAERAAACVIRYINAGQTPVALIANDRMTTRRIVAMLASRGVQLQDTTGWRLSTTRAAAQVMVALRGCAWDASTDAVLDWCKHLSQERNVATALPMATPRDSADNAWVDLERALRQKSVHRWSSVLALPFFNVRDCVRRVETWRSSMQKARSLAAWMTALVDLLQATGQWALLEDDAAGDKVLMALHLDQASAEKLRDHLRDSGRAQENLSLPEFVAWVGSVLEAASFMAPFQGVPQVVVLPFTQIVGCHFAALVMPGCDDVSLPVAPEPPGSWTLAQRNALQLPTRETLHMQQQLVWRYLFSEEIAASVSDANAPEAIKVDLLWRLANEIGETQSASPLLQLALLMQGHASKLAGCDAGADYRGIRAIRPTTVSPPQPNGMHLTVARISASAYEDLRRCPYRFFALRQLRLQESAELDAELDKRDFGSWLHAVLKAFHDALKTTPIAATDKVQRAALLDQIADSLRRSMGYQAGEFLPFAASWPQVREAYLEWLAKHEANGYSYDAGEVKSEISLGAVTLVGILDRVDRDAQAGVMVLDYKTEAEQKTKNRIKNPMEDTQLAFYAALRSEDTLRAAYVGIGDHGVVKLHEQPRVLEVRDALIEGLLADMKGIAQGVPLLALGEGVACEYCVARGLCRKDFWQ